MSSLSHLTLSQGSHLFLKRDVLLLQFAVILQQTSLPHLVLSDVIAQLTTLQLCQLRILHVRRGVVMHENRI